MRIIATLVFCLITLSGFAQTAHFYWTKHPDDSAGTSQQLDQKEWVVTVYNDGQVPVKVNVLLRNSKPDSNGKVTPSTGYMELKPGENKSENWFFTQYGVEADFQVWMEGQAATAETSSKPQQNPQPASPTSGAGNTGDSVDEVVNKAIWNKLLGEHSFSYQLVDPAYPDILMESKGTVKIAGFRDSPKVTITCFNTVTVKSTGTQNRYATQYLSTDASLNMKDYTCIAIYSRDTRGLIFTSKHKGDVVADHEFKVVEGGLVSYTMTAKDVAWCHATVICQ